MMAALSREQVITNAAELADSAKQCISVSASEKSVTIQVSRTETVIDLYLNPATLTEYDELVIDNSARHAHIFLELGKTGDRPLHLVFNNRPQAGAQLFLAAHSRTTTLDCALRIEHDSELDCFVSVREVSAGITIDAEVMRNTRAHFSGLTRTSADNAATIAMHVHHLEGMNHTEQKFYSYAADKSAITFTGKISVSPGAGESVAHQLHRGTLLSREARISAQPFLNIMHDDVRCTHGSTVGFIDEDALRYLMARGMSAHDAEKTLVDSSQRQFIDALPPAGAAFFEFEAGNE